MITKKENDQLKKALTLSGVLITGAFLSAGLDQSLPSVMSDIGNMKAAVSEAGTPTDANSVAQTAGLLPSGLKAHAVYVEDITSGAVLFAQNEHERLSLASLTKLMTALVARERFGKDTVVILTGDDLSADGDSGLRVGERWRMGDLLDVMLLVSSNDAAHAVARFVGGDGQADGDPKQARRNFVVLMNEKAQALGLSSAMFFNASGLDVDSLQNGGYASARDIAILMAELWKKYPDTLEVTIRKDARIYSQDRVAHILPNTNAAIGHYPGLLASKTGYTDIAGGNLAVVVDIGIGHPVVAVVLGSGHAERFDDMQKLVGAATSTR